MTLTLTPDIEQALDEAARRQRTTPEQVALETLALSLLPFAPNASRAATAEEERAEALARIRSGHFARLLGPSSLMRDKAEEKAREERRWK